MCIFMLGVGESSTPYGSFWVGFPGYRLGLRVSSCRAGLRALGKLGGRVVCRACRSWGKLEIRERGTRALCGARGGAAHYVSEKQDPPHWVKRLSRTRCSAGSDVPAQPRRPAPPGPGRMAEPRPRTPPNLPGVLGAGRSPFRSHLHLTRVPAAPPLFPGLGSGGVCGADPAGSTLPEAQPSGCPLRSGTPTVCCAARRRDGLGGRGRSCARREGAQGRWALGAAQGLEADIGDPAPVHARPRTRFAAGSLSSRESRLFPGESWQFRRSCLPRTPSLAEPTLQAAAHEAQPGGNRPPRSSRKPRPAEASDGRASRPTGVGQSGARRARPMAGCAGLTDGRGAGRARPGRVSAARSPSRTRRGRSPCAGRAKCPDPSPRRRPRPGPGPGGSRASER